jgi:hypothetical protein
MASRASLSLMVSVSASMTVFTLAARRTRSLVDGSGRSRRNHLLPRTCGLRRRTRCRSCPRGVSYGQHSRGAAGIGTDFRVELRPAIKRSAEEEEGSSFIWACLERRCSRSSWCSRASRPRSCAWLARCSSSSGCPFSSQVDCR